MYEPIPVDNISLGDDFDIDLNTRVGYPPARKITSLELEIGARARIRSGTVIYLGSRIGDDFETGHNVVVREECEIGDGVKIWNGTTVDYGCRIGIGVKIHCNCYVAQRTIINDNAFLAPGVVITNVKYPTGDSAKNNFEVTHISERAVIGANAIILPGIVVGEGTLVGAGSVVTRDVPPNAIVKGNPARQAGVKL